MEFVVESAGVTDGVPVSVTTPQSCGICAAVGATCSCSSGSRQSPLGFDEGPILSVHFVVQTTGIAQIVTGPVSSPQGGGGGPTVDALPTLCT